MMVHSVATQSDNPTAAPLRLTAEWAAEAARILSENAQTLHRYPEEEYPERQRAVALALDVPEAHVFLARTLGEAAEVLADALLGPGDRVAVVSEQPFIQALAVVARRRGAEVILSTAPAPGFKLVLCPPEADVDAWAAQPGTGLIVSVDPAQVPNHPRRLALFSCPEVSPNPLPPTVGVAGSAEIALACRTVLEPFHIPTPVLHLWSRAEASLNRRRGPLPAQADPAVAEVVLPAVRKLQPYVPGKGIKSMSKELGLPPEAFCKLASNEHPTGLPPSVVKRLLDRLAALASQSTAPTYAELANGVRAAILRHVQANCPSLTGWTPEQVVLGCGSVDLIKAATKAFVPLGTQPAGVLSPQWPFAMYPFEAAKWLSGYHMTPLTDARQVNVPAFVASIQQERPKLIFLANPRNPLGTGMTDLSPVLEAMAPDQTLILDEAYFDFIRFELGADHYPDGAALIQQHPDKRIVVLRTMAKAFALASFRVGFALASPAVAAELSAALPPCAVDPLSLLAAEAALAEPTLGAWVHDTVAANAAEKERLYRAFDTLGLHCVRSLANFIFFETGEAYTGQTLFDALVHSGIIIRPMPGHTARVSIGRREENDRFIAALTHALTHLPSPGDALT